MSAKSTLRTPRTVVISFVAIVAMLLSILVIAPPGNAAACTVNWDGGAGTSSWQDAANWDTDAVPVGGDHVCIDAGAPTTVSYATETLAIGTLTTNANSGLSVTSGSLTVSTGATFGADVAVSGTGTLFLDGPSTIAGGLSVDGTSASTFFGGAGATVVGGTLTFTGGTLDASPAGAGSVAAAGGTLSGTENKTVANGYGLSVASGSMVWSEGTLVLNMAGTVTVQAGAELEATGDMSANDAATAGALLTIDGTLRKSGGAGALALDLPVAVGTTGILRIESGSLDATTVGLDGTLSAPLSGFVAGSCKVAPTVVTWTARTGEFATLDLPAIPGDLEWNARYGDAALALATSPVGGFSFSDMNGHWSEANVNALSSACITVGFPDGTFRPEGIVTRAQMAVFIMRALGVFDPPVPAEDPFTDVPKNSWYGPAVAELKVRGISLGVGGGLYDPSGIVTRDNLSAYIMRALGEFYPPEPPVDPFLDVRKELWYSGFVQRMTDLGITNGCGDGKFCPYQNVRRSEMAAFIVRAWDIPAVP